jgi:hypothetical protein
METNILKCKIFLNKKPGGIAQPNGSLSDQNHSDFYINIPIIRSHKKFDDYINVEKDPLRTIITRQNINPYFFEFAFFETIKEIKSTGNINENIEEKSKLYNITINK